MHWGLETASFPVEVGVKQGDVLAPILFTIFIPTAITLIKNTLSIDDGIHIKYRLDGSLFSTRRLQARTYHQYADEVATLVHTAASDSGCSHRRLPRFGTTSKHEEDRFISATPRISFSSAVITPSSKLCQLSDTLEVPSALLTMSMQI